MAGAMRKMAVYLGLVEEADSDEYGDEDLDAPVSRHVDEHRPVRRYEEQTTAVRYSASSDGADAYRITALHPRTYNEAKAIGENFREGTPVIMNLTEMDDSDAKRLVDFSAGLVFGLRGSIERITNKVFLLSPANVDVTAEDKARIAEGGFFNQS